MPKNRYFSAFSYLFKYINPHKIWYISASLISLILVGTGIANAKITQSLVDNSISGNVSVIIIAALLFLAVIFANIILNYISGISVSILSARASRDLKQNIAALLLGAEYGEIIKQKSGDILSTINEDTNVVCDFLAGDLIKLFSQITMAIGALIYIITFNPLLALITFAYTPLGMFFTLTLNSKMNKLHPLVADYKGEALSAVEQALNQIPVIKSFIMERQIRQKIYNEYDKVYDAEMKISVWNSLLQTACGLMADIPKILFMVFAGLSVINGNLTIGGFVAVFDLLIFIIVPTLLFPFMLNDLNRTVASINRIKRLENIPQTISTEKKTNLPQSPFVKINNITFSYTMSKPILNKFNFSHKGTGIIAVCGNSGTGKTTLLDLLSGLYLPDSGTIQIQGGISVVSQDTYLFRESVIENVRLTKPNVNEQTVKEALRLAGAEEFVNTMPKKYYTMLGDGNTDLSGGQKQRISLARTILQDSKIWLLDEPTSALDSQTESIILDVIKQASKEKLIIISAHRQSLIDIADKVINLNCVQNMEGVDVNV